jgi:MFS family permease
MALGAKYRNMRKLSTDLSQHFPKQNPSTAMSQTALILAVSVTQFLPPFMLSAVGVALPAIGREFSAGAVALGLIETIYVLPGSMLLLPIGRYSDIYGRRKLFILGTAVITFATLALSLAPNVQTFIAFRFLQGIGASMIISTSFAILTAAIPIANRGRAMGIVVGSIYMGLSAGPTLAGLMVTHLGWRWIFYLAVPVESMALMLCLFKLHGEWADAAGEQFDWNGSLIYMASLLLLVLGMTHWKEWTSAKGLVVCGAVFMVVFIRHELRFPSPLVRIKPLIRNRTFALSNIATWLNYATASGSVFYFSLYLQSVKGFSPRTAGFVMVVQPILQSVTALVAGRLSDRFEASKIATFGISLCTIGLFTAVTLSEHSSISMVFCVLMLLGLGFGIFSSPNTAVIMSSVRSKDYGMASSFAATMRSLGMLTSMTIVTLLLSHFMGNQSVSAHTSPGFMNSMRTTFIVFSVLSLLGVGCSLKRIPSGQATAWRR